MTRYAEIITFYSSLWTETTFYHVFKFLVLFYIVFEFEKKKRIYFLFVIFTYVLTYLLLLLGISIAAIVMWFVFNFT